MGHQSNEARKALRAYAHDLQSTARRGGLDSVAAAAKKDDASVKLSDSGGPPQLVIAAVAVCAVLVGGIGLAITNSSTPSVERQQTDSTSAQSRSVTAVFARNGSIPTSLAIQAFSDLGMTRTVEALRAAADAGVDSFERVRDARSRLVAIVRTKLEANETVSESDPDIAIAVAALTDAVRPPGLDPEWIPPGQGGTPPGQDPDFVPPGQDPDFVSPGQDPDFVPPGQDPDFVPPGQDPDDRSPSDTAPGQTKDPNPNKGSGSNNGNGKP